MLRATVKAVEKEDATNVANTFILIVLAISAAIQDAEDAVREFQMTS